MFLATHIVTQVVSSQTGFDALLLEGGWLKGVSCCQANW